MNHTKTTYTSCQQEIIALLQDKGWSFGQLGRRVNPKETPQSIHNHLVNNRALTAENYLKYKEAITGIPLTKAEDISIDELRDQLDDIITLSLQLKADLVLFARDKRIDTEEYKTLSGRRNVITNRLDVFVSQVGKSIRNLE